ncbi:small GTPase superfamily [Gautieria morchelliformis]|nr:small GTPase superfamily [Gautieria morchelliformis]
MRQFSSVVLGAGGVGKSALTVRWVREVFLDSYDPTIEEAYRRQVKVDDELTSLEVTDTAGAEQFTALNEFYIKSADGFVLVFSLTQETSLREVETLRQQIYRVKGTSTAVPIVVVGTKSDLTAEREVHRSHIQALSRSWSLPFYETSAKRNWHVDDVFEDLVRQMRARYPEDVVRRKKRRAKHSPGCIVA